MARSTSLIVLLTALVIQVVLACSGIEKGQYLIEFGGKSLTAGPIPRVYPLPDRPAILSNYFVTPWLVEPTEGGYTIRDPRYEDSYRLSVSGEYAIFSVSKNAPTWAVSSAGNGYYTIGLAGTDLLLTAPYGDEPATLRPAYGTPDQKWILRPLEHRNLYPNRFQHIL
ncbi:hypothetical protein BGZ72_007136 [Mortierella alpina]|nr:hypothetical protein BGZ72_007136 [Mortierella alpina]